MPIIHTADTVTRHFEYTTEDGSRASGAQRMGILPRESVSSITRKMDKLLVILAHGHHYSDVVAFPHTLPTHKVMERINAVRAQNGDDPLYTAEDMKQAQRPQREIVIGHVDENGNPVAQGLIKPTSPPTVTHLTDEAVSAAAGVVLQHANAAQDADPVTTQPA